MIREPCGCEYGVSCELHSELAELDELRAEDWGNLTFREHVRLGELEEWDLWLERMEADA